MICPELVVFPFQSPSNHIRQNLHLQRCAYIHQTATGTQQLFWKYRKVNNLCCLQLFVSLFRFSFNRRVHKLWVRVKLFRIRPHRGMYVDAAYSYRQSTASSVVCLSVSVCLSVTLVTLQKRLHRSRCRLVEDLGGLRDPCIRWGPDPPMGRGKFLGENWHPIVKYRDTLRSCVQRPLNR